MSQQIAAMNPIHDIAINPTILVPLGIASYATTFSITFPWTSVRRKSRPWKR